jgi:predicted RNA binding protein YcfA (HicA-like mRNA interferase family)
VTQWPSTKARRIYAALLGVGWQLKRQSGSHRTLSRARRELASVAKGASVARRRNDRVSCRWAHAHHVLQPSRHGIRATGEPYCTVAGGDALIEPLEVLARPGPIAHTEKEFFARSTAADVISIRDFPLVLD